MPEFGLEIVRGSVVLMLMSRTVPCGSTSGAIVHHHLDFVIGDELRRHRSRAACDDQVVTPWPYQSPVASSVSAKRVNPTTIGSGTCIISLLSRVRLHTPSARRHTGQHAGRHMGVASFCLKYSTQPSRYAPRRRIGLPDTKETRTGSLRFRNAVVKPDCGTVEAQALCVDGNSGRRLCGLGMRDALDKFQNLSDRPAR
jgi:hypothetical protein